VLFVGRNLLANGRGRWLAAAASVAVSAAMLYAQGTEPPCCVGIPAVTPTGEAAVSASAPHAASPAEAELLAASAPVANREVPFALPAGVASEVGLQVKTIWAARAISVMFPEITNLGGFRQDPLKWHPNGLAIDVMIPNWDTDEAKSSATSSPGTPWRMRNDGEWSM
jgi:hypothetical protein